MGESLRSEFDLGRGRIFPSGRLLLLFWRLGFLHLELGHHIHQEHNIRMQKTIQRFKCAKIVVLAAIIKPWEMCKFGCFAAYIFRPPVTIIVCPDT